MDAFEKLLSVGAAAAILYGISFVKKGNRAWNEKIEEEQRRRNTPFHYPKDIPPEKFREIILQSIKPIKKKIREIRLREGVIYGTVISQTGLTEWNFTLDFNDYGKLTGTFRLRSENSDSLLPERLGMVIQNRINELLDETESDGYDMEVDVTSAEQEEVYKKAEKITSNKQISIKRTRKHKGIIIAFVSVLISIIFLLFSYYEYQKMIFVGYSNEELEGLNYKDVVYMLKESGFSNVHIKEIPDLTLSRENEENLVKEIRLGLRNSFDEETKYPSNLWITVVYHTIELYKPPFTSKEAKGMNYLDAIKEYEKIGFINIKLNVEYDIVTGWLTDDGEVESITINGENNYVYYEQFRPDAEVVITYHTYKKNDPSK